MSHTSTVAAIKIVSVSALRAAVAELAAGGMRISLDENASPRAYSTNQAGMGRADFVIRIPDAKYDVGLYKDAEGHYEARTDFFMGSVAACLGAVPSKPENRDQAQLGKLFQAYGVCAATETARAKGLMVQRRVKPNGHIALELTGPGL